jgi:tetratricopeptide (TPR) repeat protein
VALKKPSDIFDNKFEDNNTPVIVTDSSFRDELNKVESLSEQVIQLQQELSQKVVKNDLESLVLSQINNMQENFEYLQNDFRKSNKKDILDFKERVSELTEIVGNLVENELPKYKKQVTKNEVRIGDKFDELKEVVEENIVGIREEIDTKVNDIAEVIDDNLEFFNNQFQQTSSEVKKTTDTYNKIFKILENKISKENERNDLYIDEKFNDLKEDVEENIVEIKKEVDNNLEYFNNQLQETSSEVKKTTDTYNKISKILENKVSKENERNDLYINDKFDELKEVVGENIVGIKKEVDNSLEVFNNQIQETSSEVKKTTDTYNKISKILENKVSKENDKLEEYSQVIQSIHEAFLQLDKSIQEKTSTHQQVVGEFIEEKFETINSVVTNRIDSIDDEVDTFKNKVSSEVSNIKSDVVIFEKHNKDTEKTIKEFSEQLSVISKIDESIEELNDDIDKLQNQYDEVYNQSTETKKDLEIVERYIQNHHQDIIELKEEVFAEIEQIPVGNLQENLERLERKIDYIKETYSKIDPKVIVKEVIKEGLLNEPPTTKNSDPLTPLNQKFVTLDQLQEHYRIFINRIQQQLSTLGGGGETKLKYLDDIVGIATNASAYDGKFLKYDHSSGKFIFTSPPAAGSIEVPNVLYVTKGGNNSNTGRSLGDAKLTIKAAVAVANAGCVIKVSAGDYTEDNPITLPDQISIVGDNLREVSITPQNQDDLFYVGNGNYITNVSFTGSANPNAVISFDPLNKRYITQSPYIQNCTNFIPNSIGLKVDGKNAFGSIKSMVLDSYTQYNQGGIGASMTNEGYAQLVSLFTICDDIAVFCGSGGGCDLTNSNSSFGNYGLVADGIGPVKYTGIVTVATDNNNDTFVIDLNVPTLNVTEALYNNITGLTTITVNSAHNFNVGMGVTIAGLGFTCPSGPGIVTYPSGNKGYVFEVSNIASSTSFEVYVGISTLQHTYVSGGTVKTSVSKPYSGQGIYFGNLYYEIQKIIVTNGGSGYTTPPLVTINEPTGPRSVAAKAKAIIENGKVTEIQVIRSGRGFETIPSISISGTATASAVMKPIYYGITKATEISSGVYVITLNKSVPYSVGVGTSVPFARISKILASGHSLEYIGTGTTITSALPVFGGTLIQDNEIDMRNGGSVIFTTTDQSGNFRIGDGVIIDQEIGVIGGKSFSKGLFAQVTPLIIALQ